MNTFQNVKSKVKAGSLPPRARKLLEKIGDEQIISMTVVRTPIQSVVNALLNIISLDQFKEVLKILNYDDAMPLTLFINQKNHVIKLAESNPIKPNSQSMTFNFRPTTIAQLMEMKTLVGIIPLIIIARIK